MSSKWKQFKGTNYSVIRVPDRYKAPKPFDGNKPFNETHDLWYDPIDPEYECDIVRYFAINKYPYGESIPDILPRNVRSGILKLSHALNAYIKHTGLRYINLSDLIAYSTEVQKIKIHKKLRKKVFCELYKLEFIDSREFEIIKSPYHDVVCIGDVFNYRFCIFYKESIDDYEKGFIPVDINPSTLEDYQSIVEDLLPDEFINLEPLWVFQQCNGSRGMKEDWDEDDNKSIKTSENIYSVDIPSVSLKAKRCVIPIHAQNVRDAIIVDNFTSCNIRWIDYHIKKLCKNIKGFCMIDNPIIINSRMEKLYDKYKTFFCFDYEKEGITKPRELLIAIALAIKNKYGENELSSRMLKLWESFELLVDGEFKYPLRGHGLGMANALTTLMSVVVFHLTNERLLQEEGFEYKCDILAFNDDAVIGFKEEDEFLLFEEYFTQICSELSLLYQKEKSFFGDVFVFCENYYPERFNNKDVYYYCAIEEAKMCYNIVHAKQYLSSFCTPDILEGCYEDIVSYWGWELYPEESDYPIIFGGWCSRKIIGVDLSLWDMTAFFSDAYEAVKTTIPLHRAEDHPFLLFADKEDLFKFELPVDIRINGLNLFKYFNSLMKKRREIYDRGSDMHLMDVYRDYRNRSRCDVLPPKSCCKFVYLDDLKPLKFTHKVSLYGSKDPLHDYLNGKPFSYIYGEDFGYASLTAREMIERDKYITSFTNIKTRFNYDGENYYCSQLEKYYAHPNNVIQVIKFLSNYDSDYRIPIPDEEWSEIISIKKDYYKEIISNEDMQIILEKGLDFSLINEFLSLTKEEKNTFAETPYEVDAEDLSEATDPRVGINTSFEQIKWPKRVVKKQPAESSFVSPMTGVYVTPPTSGIPVMKITMWDYLYHFTGNIRRIRIAQSAEEKYWKSALWWINSVLTYDDKFVLYAQKIIDLNFQAAYKVYPEVFTGIMTLVMSARGLLVPVFTEPDRFWKDGSVVLDAFHGVGGRNQGEPIPLEVVVEHPKVSEIVTVDLPVDSHESDEELNVQSAFDFLEAMEDF